MSERVRPSQVYTGRTKAEIQVYLKGRGYKVVAFRVPRQGEYYLQGKYDSISWLDHRPILDQLLGPLYERLIVKAVPQS